MFYFRPFSLLALFAMLCLFACSSAEKRGKKRQRRVSAVSQAASAESASAARRAAASAKRGAAKGQGGARRPASARSLFSEEGGAFDFLSQKLEDTVAGYEEMKSQITVLEKRLSQLIALIEAQLSEADEMEGPIDMELSEPLAEPPLAARPKAERSDEGPSAASQGASPRSGLLPEAKKAP